MEILIWPQCHPLGHTTSDWPPAGICAAGHYTLNPAVQVVFQSTSLSSLSGVESIVNPGKAMLVLRNRKLLSISDAFSPLPLGILEGKHLTALNIIV